MKTSFRPRYLIATLSLIALTAAGRLIAALPTDTPIPVLFSTLSVENDIRGLFYDIGTNTIPVTANSNYLSSPYKAPPSGHVKLYRLKPSGKNMEPEKVTVAELDLTSDGPFLVLFRGRGENLHCDVLDNSWKANPLMSSRVINASKRKTAVQVGQSLAELEPGELHSYPAPEQLTDIVDFKVATQEDGKWTLRVLSPQAIYPGTRNIFVLKEQPPTLDRPQPKDLDVFRVIDATQPPLVKN